MPGEMTSVVVDGVDESMYQKTGIKSVVKNHVRLLCSANYHTVINLERKEL